MDRNAWPTSRRNARPTSSESAYWDWEQQPNGNWIGRDEEGEFRGTVFQKDGGWRWVIDDVFARGSYESAADAMTGAESFAGELAHVRNASRERQAIANAVWKRSAKGNLYRLTAEGVITIYQQRWNGMWAVLRDGSRLLHRPRPGAVTGEYQSEAVAQLHADVAVRDNAPQLYPEDERPTGSSIWWAMSEEALAR